MESERADVITDRPVNVEEVRETRLHIIDIVRSAACLMIFLYHCNTILPGEFRFLTFFGEDMGNELFFLISGFALYPSIMKTGTGDFLSWYLKRLKKILPVLILFYILSYLTGFYSLKDPAQLFAVFIYPTLYWFVTAILVFYILLFFFVKIKAGYVKTAILALILMIYIFRAGTMEGYYLIGAFSMGLGALLREKTPSPDRGRSSEIRTGAIAIASFIFYMAVKYIKFTGRIMTAGPADLASVLPGLGAVITGGTILVLGVLEKDPLNRFFADKEKLLGFIRYPGTLALYIYMVQCFNAGIIGYTIGLKVKFPLSFAVNFIVIWGFAGIVNKVMSLK